MGSLDAPGFWIEVVGSIADVLRWSEGETVIGQGDNAARCVCRQYKCLAAQVAHSLGVGDFLFDVRGRKGNGTS